MCGIYCVLKSSENNQSQNLFQNMVEGLSSLQYRGYDSWGFGYVTKLGNYNRLVCYKTLKKEIKIPPDLLFGLEETNCVIGHTRWADTCKVSKENSHPIGDCDNKVLLVHNGTISNTVEISKKLTVLKGKEFVLRSETDTEYIANLFSYHFSSLKNDPEARIENIIETANSQLNGVWAVCFVHVDYPNHIFFSVNKSSLFIHEKGYISSDLNSLPDGGFYKLNDGEFGFVYDTDIEPKINSGVKFSVFNSYGIKQEIEWTVKRTPCLNTGEFIINKNSTPNMWQEIVSQPGLVSDFDDSKLLSRVTPFSRNMTFFGCGSSYNAALLSRLYFRDNHWMIPEVQYASEFTFYDSGYLDRYFLPISQSGETLDVISTIKELKKIINNDKGFKSKICSIVNNIHSSVSLLSDNTLDIQAGPELSVAATKSFTMTCFALYCQSMKNKNKLYRDDLVKAMADTLQLSIDIKQIVNEIFHYKNALYLSSGYGYPIAREGALKLKEIAYVHAEAMPAAEVKHGPLALIDDTIFSVFIVNDMDRIERIVGNINQVKSRGGKVILVVDKSNPEVYNKSVDWKIITPTVSRQLQPLINNVVLQLLAYHMAIKKNCNVDMPRSLAKSITIH